ncbi:MAG: hypothetical protein JWM00_39 [Candidatus Saccharibacteria bacterium]|nr:hypothetical protein [Candidatus Saccharibacteria bacterium]
MNTVRHDGFTVIETMLFLAVSGALVIAILAGSGIAISQQRYRDAAIGIESLLQSQYADTSNVVNSRGDNLECGSDGNDGGKILIAPGSGTRGASECVVLGRYVRFMANGTGTNVTTANVIGLRFDEAPVTNDIDALKQYRMTRSSIDEEITPVAWGAQVIPQDVIVLVLRSPFSGSLRTFIPTGVMPDPDSREIQANAVDALNAEQTLCLDTNGFSTGQATGITIRAAAGGASAIEMEAESGPC